MSRRKDRCKKYSQYDFMMRYYEESSCNCNLKLLVILILIILQFGRKKHFSRDRRHCKDHQLVDNSILFIIALHYLSCC
jgi:hypothetical protein